MALKIKESEDFRFNENFDVKSRRKSTNVQNKGILKGLQSKQDLDKLSIVSRGSRPSTVNKYSHKGRSIRSSINTKSNMRNAPQLKSVFDDQTIKTNDIIKRIKEFNQIKDTLQK